MTAEAEWSSSTASAASVGSGTGSGGLVTAAAPGTAVISAVYEGLSGAATFTVDEVEGRTYDGTETTLDLKRGGANQFLLPVEIGSQTLNLLVDTGSNALLVFDDRVARSNTPVKRSEQTLTVTDTEVSKSYSSTSRTGLLATAPVRIGAYFAAEMRIMLIQTPDSQNDPSLTAKGADGIIGLRRTEGLAQNPDPVLLDVPLGTLRPSVSTFELDLPPSGNASLSFGHKPVLDLAEPQYVFRAKTFSVKDPANPVSASYSDLQVPFRAKSSFGSADTGNLDILLDTGAVSKLVLDTEVAKSLGYNPSSGTWAIPEDEEIKLNLVGPGETITLYPKFRVSEISVAPYSTMGVEFEAVLGISRWQEYVVGFDFVDYQDGGPDGTISLLRRLDRKDAVGSKLPTLHAAFAPLAGLNSFGDDRFPSSDASGNTVVFQSDRPDGKGGWDIYVWQKGAGILNLPNLNSTGDDSYPRISADGRYLVFHSDREGGAGAYDVYLCDLTQKTFVSVPGLNTSSLERNPWISGDGSYIAFRSERSGGYGGSDVYLYDRGAQGYVSLPGLNTEGSESLPALNEDGSLLSFTGVRADAVNGGPDIYLYDVKNGDMISLSQGMSGVNTKYREQFSAICPGAMFIAFQTDRTNPDMGLYDRDITVVHAASMNAVLMRGLSSDADDTAPFFSADGNFMLFHSRRPGGEGGSDIYMYRMSGIQETPVPAGSETGDIKLTKTSDGLFTVPATSGSRILNLLAETGLSALVLFEDRIPSDVVISTGGDVSLKLPGGGVLNGKAATADIAVGGVKASGMRIVLAKSGDYAALTGLSLSGAEGVFGMYRKRSEGDVTGTADIPLAVLQPAVSMAEFNFDPAGVPGLSLGSMPVIEGVPANMLFNTYVQGRITDPNDPEGTAFTDLEVAVTPVAVKGEDYKVGAKHVFLLSSTLKNRIILDTAVAAELGDLSRWQDIYLFVTGSESMLRAVECPAGQAQIKDLSGSDYDGIIGIDFWQSFVTGFDTVGLAGGGPSGVVSFLRRADIGGAGGSSAASDTHHFVALPGLNSTADDSFGDISDDGNTIVFQSNRAGSVDICVWRNGQGLLNLTGLNSASAADMSPRISGDGRYMVFYSDRTGSADVYLYDLTAGAFVDLPGLNTEYNERFPDISADGAVLAFQLSGSPDNIDGNADIRFYSIGGKEMLLTPSGWLNTRGDELLPSLNRDGSLTAFGGIGREDSRGGYDVYLWKNTGGGLVDLKTRLNTVYTEGAPSLSAEGGFIALTSDRNSPDLGHRGRDIFLFETASEEFLFLPGMNSEFEEGAPALSENAKYILFHSKRPGGEGGYDIYLYSRDTEDNTPYTASESYTEDGAVTESGKAVAGAKVSAVDLDGRTVATATTDESGSFSITVPAGTALPVKYETSAENAEVVTDEVGFVGTYVPDFEAGNLKFTQVWIEDKAQTGFTTTVRFDVETTTPAYNTYIKVYLKKGNPSEIELNGGIGFTPDYDLTALVIDKLGQKGLISEPVVNTQGDIVTKVTYLPGTENRKARVEHTFIVPSGIADGTYTAVFSINMLDINPADNAIQGETSADQSDNYMIASVATIIGNPDKPNLRILSASLVTNSFELPNAEDAQNSDDINSVSGRSALTLNMEVESMAQDTVKPTDIIFELVIDGSRYPLWFEGQNDAGAVIKQNIFTYEAACRPEDRPGYPEGQRCASLFRQEQTGRTYNLYLSQAAYDILKTRTSDTPCQVVIKVDPNNTIEEWENNKADNVKNLSVMYLAPQVPLRSLRAKYQIVIFDKKLDDKYGNDYWNGGYSIADSMSYKVTNFGSVEIPTAGDIDLMNNEVYVTCFGKKKPVLEAGAKCSIDIDNIPDSSDEYVVKVMGEKIFGESKKLQTPAGACDNECSECKKNCPDDKCKENCGKRFAEGEIWNSKDLAGNEMWSKSKESEEFKKTLNVGPVPVTIAAKAKGELGLRASLKIAANNKVILEGGPYASLTAEVSGGVGLLLIVGIECEVTLIKSFFGVNIGVQILPSYPLAIIRVALPLTLKAIEGKITAFIKADLGFWKKVLAEEKIFEWDSIIENTWYPIMDPKSWAFGADTFKGLYSTSSDFKGSIPFTENALYHDWGNKGPSGLSKTDNFFASWEGYFNIDSGLMNFYAEADDGMEVWVDWNDDEKFSKDEKVIDHADAPWTGTVSKDVSVADAGYHKIRVVYNEKTGNAKAKFYWVKDNEYAAWYWNNTDLSGDPVLFRRENSIDYNWGTGSPYGDKDKNVVNPDNFSVRWEGNIDFPTDGSYTVIANADKGTVSVWVEDQLKATGSSFYVTKGKHKIKAEYKHFTGNAKVNVGFAPKGKFLARYFKNTDRTGTSAKTAIEDKIDYQWGTSGAIASVKDNFSAIWEGYFSFENGNYDFIAHVNDRMWIWIDGEQIYADRLDRPKSKAFLVTRKMKAGDHHIRVEYTECDGDATARLNWSKQKDNEFTATYYDGNPTGISDPDASPTRIEKISSIAYNPQTYQGISVGSVSYEGWAEFDNGIYKFSLTTVGNLWIDNVLTIDQGTKMVLPINKGRHLIRLEVAVNGYNPEINLYRSKVENRNGLVGMAFANQNHSGISCDDDLYYWMRARDIYDDGHQYPIYFQHYIPDGWEDGGNPCLKSSNFSVRLFGVFSVQKDATYYFMAQADDMKIWVDGQPLINDWNGKQTGASFAEIKLAQGDHLIQVEYRNLGVSPPTSPAVRIGWNTDGWACVYRNPNFGGETFCFSKDISGAKFELDLTGSDWNDTISSVKVSGNITFTGFDKGGYQGDSITIKGPKGNSSLGKMDKKISSFRIE